MPRNQRSAGHVVVWYEIDILTSTWVVCRMIQAVERMTMQGDELRLQCMEQMSSFLTNRHLAYYLLAPLDMLQLQ